MLLAALVLAVPPAPEFFAAHRQRLLDRLPAGAVAVFHAAPESQAEVDSDPYRQDSTFWWLTGFGEPDSVVVLRKDPASGPRYVMFVPPRDAAAEQWNGWRKGVEGASREHQAEAAYTNAEVWKRLPELWRGARALVVSDGGTPPSGRGCSRPGGQPTRTRRSRARSPTRRPSSAPCA
jgi:Xaa-Pro aminopeptidase